MHLVVVRVGTAADIVPANYGNPAPERPGPELLPRGVPHEQMPAKSGRYAGFEGVIHKAGPWVRRPSGQRGNPQRGQAGPWVVW